MKAYQFPRHNEICSDGFYFVGKCCFFTEVFMETPLIPVIKYTLLFFNSAYAVCRILNIHFKVNCKKVVLLILGAAIISFLSVLCNWLQIPVAAVVVVAISAVLYTVLYHINFDTALVASVIGYGICYCFYGLSAFFVSSIEFAFSIQINVANETILALVIGVLQFGPLYLLFCIRRLKNGFSFLDNPLHRDLGVIISCFILLVITTLSMEPTSDKIVAVLFYTLLACGIILWFWWRSRTTRDYIERLREKDMEELQAQVLCLESATDILQSENERLSQLIHKDNKLLPAMELSIRRILYEAYRHGDSDLATQAQAIAAQLDSISKERAGVVKNYERQSKRIPLTNISVIDALLSFMQQKAFVAGIDFDVTLWGMPLS